MTAAVRRFPLAAIMLLGLVLRLINLDGRTTEYDEIVSVWFAAADLGAMVRGTAADTMPPLYYALLHRWAPAVSPLWWERLPSVAFSLAALPVLYLLGRRTVGRPAALIGTALMAVSPFFVFFAQFARMYALLTLLILLAALGLYEALRTGRAVAWAGYALAALAALYTHNLAALNLAALHLAALPVLAARKDRRMAVAGLLAADAVIALGYAPWLARLPEQLDKVNRAFWIPVPGAAELVRTPVFFLFNLPAPGWAVPVLLFWTALLVAAAVRAALSRGRAHWAEPPSPGLLFAALLAVTPVALLFLVSQVRPVYVERGMMAAAAAGYLLLGWTFTHLPRPTERRALAIGTAALLAGALVYYYSYAEFPRSRYREAASVLAAQVAPGDAVLHETKLSYFPMRYFRPDLPHHFVADPPGSPNDTLAPATMATFGIAPSHTADVAASHARVWAVLYTRSFAEAANAGGAPAVIRELSARMTPGPAQTVGDIVLVPFVRTGP